MSRPEDTYGTRLVGRPFVFTVCSTFAGMLSLGILLPVLPRYAEGPLSAGAVAVGLSVGASSITAVLAPPLVGRVGDTPAAERGRDRNLLGLRRRRDRRRRGRAGRDRRRVRLPGRVPWPPRSWPLRACRS
jgi:MFS family permease